MTDTDVDAEAEEPAVDDNAEDGEGGEGGAKRFNGRFIVLFILAPLLGLSLIGGGLYFSGIFGSSDEDQESVAQAPMPDPVFYDLPEFLANLNTDGRAAKYLKMRVALELTDTNAIPHLEATMPRAIDTFQVYLRELRPEDLEGSAGMFRLKEELLRRLNEAAYPVVVQDILFNEIVVQ